MNRENFEKAGTLIKKIKDLKWRITMIKEEMDDDRPFHIGCGDAVLGLGQERGEELIKETLKNAEDEISGLEQELAEL